MKINLIVVACISLSMLLTALFGISLVAFFKHIPMWEGAFQMLLMAGTGWIFQIIFAFVGMKQKFKPYLLALAYLMVLGLLVLIPSMLLSLVLGIYHYYIPLGSVMLSSTLMLVLHIRTIKSLNISQKWTISWFLSLQITALAWVYYFHFMSM